MSASVSGRKCDLCHTNTPKMARPRTQQRLCKECFVSTFETEVHQTIVNNNLLKPGERIAAAVSGGKDSSVLAHVLAVLNERYQYGVELVMLSIDEGIKGYRDDSLKVSTLRVCSVSCVRLLKRIAPSTTCLSRYCRLRTCLAGLWTR